MVEYLYGKLTALGLIPEHQKIKSKFYTVSITYIMFLKLKTELILYLLSLSRFD